MSNSDQLNDSVGVCPLKFHFPSNQVAIETYFEALGGFLGRMFSEIGPRSLRHWRLAILVVDILHGFPPVRLRE